AVQHHHLAPRLRQGDAQANRRRQAHGPDHIKILRSVAQRVDFPRGESVADDDKLVGEQLEHRADRTAAAGEYPFFGPHESTPLGTSKASGMCCDMKTCPAQPTSSRT